MIWFQPDMRGYICVVVGNLIFYYLVALAASKVSGLVK